jgi:hypothetical protein
MSKWSVPINKRRAAGNQGGLRRKARIAARAVQPSGAKGLPDASGYQREPFYSEHIDFLCIKSFAMW